MAVISDVHANSFALSAVLRDARARGASSVYCLGDVVGYNAHVHETLNMLRTAQVPVVKGNHDMMAIEELPIEDCGPNARRSQHWTRLELTAEEREYLRELPTELLAHEDTVLVHSRLHDPINYLARDADYLAEFERLRAWQPTARVCFTGHTHVPRIVEVTPQREVRRLSQTSAYLAPDSFYFINPGSVGHPRGGDFRACYALFDRDRNHVHLMRVRYDKSAMLAANRRVGIGTDLGPGVLAHEVSRLTQRLKRVIGQ
jgi:predicted phosphodiesterase